jgi:F0F1-type ATP synthase assembly protein I
MSSRKSPIKWGDAVWVLGMGARGGLLIALPVLAGLAVGYLLDSRFGTLPWISLVLTAIGGFVGPFMLYRWVVSAVKKRLEAEPDEEKSE